MKRTPRNNAHLNIVAPQVLKDAVQTAAARNWQSANAYARGALLAALKRDGIKVELSVDVGEAA